MPVESLDGRKHHHGDHNREKVFFQRDTGSGVAVLDTIVVREPFPGWNNIGGEGKKEILMFSFFLLKQTTNNPLGRLAADWLVSVEMAAPTPERPSRSPPSLPTLSLPLRELLHSDSSYYLPFFFLPFRLKLIFSIPRFF